MTEHSATEAVQHLMATIFKMQRALVALAPDYRWQGLGNLLGDYGEYVAMTVYGLRKAPAGAAGYDALTPDGRKVQIKSNRAASMVGVRGNADLLLVLGVDDNAEIEEIYFGDFAEAIAVGRRSERDNKISIPVAKLRNLSHDNFPP